MLQKLDKGIVASIVAPFFIALSILMAKIAGQHTSALFVAGLGCLVSVPILLVAAICSRASLKLDVLLGAARKPFMQVLFTRAIAGQALIILGFTMTSAVKSILLLRLEPIFVFIWSILLLGEKPTIGKGSLLALLLVGSVLAAWPGDSLSAPNLGDALVILSLLFLSYSYLPTQKIAEQGATRGLNVLTNSIGGLALTIAAIVCRGDGTFPSSLDAWAAISGYSLSFFVIGVSLYYYAFHTVKPWIIASLLSLEVVYGLALAVILLSEKITALQLCGAVVSLVATVLIALYRQHEESRKAHQQETAPPSADQMTACPR